MSSSDAAAGALLGTFVGDAMGAPWEGRSPTPPGAGELRIDDSLARGELRYTDDTQMALALAEHLCVDPQVEPESLARTFLEHFEPDRGYGSGTRQIVARWREGMPAARAATADFPEGSLGNGAAMRVAPVGVLWAHDPIRLAEVALRSAALTHAHPVGIDGAVVQARAVGLAVVRGRFGPDELAELAASAATPELREGLADARRLCDDPPEQPVEVAVELGTSPVAHRSVPAALWLAASSDSFAEAVMGALELGGDMDTIAAMAGAVLGAAGGLDVIPKEWLDLLEDGPRGRAYTMALARRLADVAEGLRRGG
ncbi:MAG: ADP-ribosylglycohydrolase family protein [Egibacteraceae bacterium]